MRPAQNQTDDYDTHVSVLKGDFRIKISKCVEAPLDFEIVTRPISIQEMGGIDNYHLSPSLFLTCLQSRIEILKNQIAAVTIR